MRNQLLIAAVAPLSLALAGCYDSDDANYSDNGYNAADANYSGNADYDANAAASGYGGATAGAWPEGARIVVEDGVTYRIDADGTRVRLGDSDARVIVEDGVRFRVDPDGTRVRIDEQGATVSVGPGGVDTTVPVGGDTRVTVNSN